MLGCIVCNSFSLRHICRNCIEGALAPSFFTRDIEDLRVFSFYKYSEISSLIHYKHRLAGSFIIEQLANASFKKFAENFEYQGKISVVAIDDNIKNGYSHTAILAHTMKNKIFTPDWGAMRAKNSVLYAGQSLEFRKSNPRNFRFKGAKHKDIILVDDIVTTGTTLLEAKECAEKNGYEVLFAVTLADAKE